MTKTTVIDRYDLHDRHARQAETSFVGRALASAGWEWDTTPHYGDAKNSETLRCTVIIWHATTGQVIKRIVAEESMDYEILDLILEHQAARV
jgi:hypothetical protein